MRYATMILVCKQLNVSHFDVIKTVAAECFVSSFKIFLLHKFWIFFVSSSACFFFFFFIWIYCNNIFQLPSLFVLSFCFCTVYSVCIGFTAFYPNFCLDIFLVYRTLLYRYLRRFRNSPIKSYAMT